MKVRLILEGGKATAAPPVGPALGSKGLPAQQFCVKFNEETKHLQGVHLNVSVDIGKDKAFKIEYKPNLGSAIKKKAGVTKCTPGINTGLNINQIEELAEEFGSYYPNTSKEGLINSIMGTIKSMNLKVTA